MRSLQCVKIERSHLFPLLIKSTQYIDSLMGHLNSSSADTYFERYREGILISKLAWPKCFTVLNNVDTTIEPLGSTISQDDGLEFLASLRAINGQAINEINRGNPLINNWIYLTDEIVGPGLLKKSASNVGTVYSIKLIDGVHCDKCLIIRERTDMEKHQLHPECIIQADKNRMDEKGYIKIESLDDMLAVRQADVDHEMISAFWSAYVPTWVNEAIKTFHKSGSEFAGMELAEFLRAMKPEAKQP